MNISHIWGVCLFKILPKLAFTKKTPNKHKKRCFKFERIYSLKFLLYLCAYICVLHFFNCSVSCGKVNVKRISSRLTVCINSPVIFVPFKFSRVLKAYFPLLLSYKRYCIKPKFLSLYAFCH